MQIRNEAVLVTGASQGLGRALAHALAKAGARVVMVARGERDLEKAVQAIRAELHEGEGTVYGLAFDVGDKEAVHKLTGAAAALVGPIGIVIHNASTLGAVPMPLLMDTACEDLERVLAVNLVGPFRLTKVLAGPMVLKGRGLVLHVSSDAAVSAYARWGAYGVSKAAQDHLARTFAAELDPVRFFSVDPGEMDTKMHADALPEADRATLARPAAVAEQLLEIIRNAAAFPNGARLIASEVAATLAAKNQEAS
jgi:NAD(P)-dependent dehydrogenase (short-subunit alcohol dehydrogenase family)